MLKPKADRRPTLRPWPMTVADVYLSAVMDASGLFGIFLVKRKDPHRSSPSRGAFPER